MRLSYSGQNYADFVRSVYDNGSAVDSRQGATRELLCASYEITGRDYIVADLTRRFNLGFGFIEFATMLTGNDGLKLYTKHIANYGKFSSNGYSLDNAYGQRLRGIMSLDGEHKYSGCNQIAKCVQILKKDSNARYAVATINSGQLDLESSSSHVPCTLSLQWLVRDGKLNQILTMRSNDAVKGVTYDVFSFGLLHEAMSQLTGYEIGQFFVNAGSLHVYCSDFDLMSKLQSTQKSTKINFEGNIGGDISALQVLLNAVSVDVNADVIIEHTANMDCTWLKDLIYASYARFYPELIILVSGYNAQLTQLQTQLWGSKW